MIGQRERCSFVWRVRIHPSIIIGGVSLGQCERKPLPEMNVCTEHADKEAMGLVIRVLARKLKQLERCSVVSAASGAIPLCVLIRMTLVLEDNNRII